MTDQEATIAAIVVRERNRLRRFIRARVSDPSDVEDIVQDVLFEFVEAYRLPLPIERASSWLMRVARNRVIDLFRQKGRRRSRGGGGVQVEEGKRAADGEHAVDDEPRMDLLLPAPDASPEAAYVRTVLLAELQSAIEELPGEQREIFIQHELEGVSFKELASRSGVSINTLLARKRYAVLALRGRLQSIYDEFEI